MMIRAFASNVQGFRQHDRQLYSWMGRVDRSLRRLKVSHSQLRIGVGMLRESFDSMNRQVAQQRADIHDLEHEFRRLRSNSNG